MDDNIVIKAPWTSIDHASLIQIQFARSFKGKVVSHIEVGERQFQFSLEIVEEFFEKCLSILVAAP